MKTSYLSPIVLFFFTTWSFTAEGVKTIPDSAAALGMIGGRFANLMLKEPTSSSIFRPGMAKPTSNKPELV
jgi:hypothetical protein